MAITPRIKLRTDSYANWARSLVPLYEGEVGIGYDIYHNDVTGTDEKYNFKIKIGRAVGTHNFCSWEEAADLSIAKLNPEDLQDIADKVIEQLGEDIFVTKGTFNRFKEQFDDELQAINDRLSNRVKACVSDAVLLLSTED